MLSQANHLRRQPTIRLMEPEERATILQRLADAACSLAAEALAEHDFCRAIGERWGLGECDEDDVVAAVSIYETVSWGAALRRWAEVVGRWPHRTVPDPPQRRRELVFGRVWREVCRVAAAVEEELAAQVEAARVGAEAAWAVGEGADGALAAAAACGPWLRQEERERLAVEAGLLWRSRRFDQAWRDDATERAAALVSPQQAAP